MRASSRHPITGFIARKVDYGESDLIVTLITQEEGRIEAMARGARRSKKRFEAGLSYYIMYEGTVQKRGENSLWLLNGLTIKRTFPSLLSGTGQMSTAAYGTELIRELTPPLEQSTPSFHLLEQFYAAMDNNQGAPKGPLVWLQYNLLAEAGYIPPAQACTLCQKEAGPGKWAVSSRTGGIFCDTCAPNSARRFSWDQLVFLTSFPPLPALEDTTNHLFSLFQKRTEAILGHPLKSSSLL